MKYIIAITILTIGSYTDLKTRTAPDTLWLILGGFGIIFIITTTINIFYLIVMVAFLVILYLISKVTDKIGGADLKALMALAILFPYPMMGYLPPAYSIFIYAYIVTFCSIPIVYLLNKNRSWMYVLMEYENPFLVFLTMGFGIYVMFGEVEAYL